MPSGWHRLRVRRGGRTDETRLLVAPVAPAPPRAWGFTAQLYSVRSRGSWGLGDLRDLADLAAWSGRELGAGFVLVNPLHAGEPVPPIGPSPYLPMSRRFTSPLYLRVEDMPEYALPARRADRERLAALAGGCARTMDCSDRDAVWAAKRAALELLYRLLAGAPGGSGRPGYEAFRRARGRRARRLRHVVRARPRSTAHWSTAWPLAAVRPDPVAAERRGHARTAPAPASTRGCSGAWTSSSRRRSAAARDAGMPVGVVHDLAVGVPPAARTPGRTRTCSRPG